MKYLLFFLLIFNLSCNAQDNKCKQFKTGTFAYVGLEYEDSIIIRNDSIQVESNSKSGYKATAYIDWLSDCQYTLTFKEVNNPKSQYLIGTSFTVDIISTSKNSYKYRGYDDVYEITGEIFKID
ncbi:hypothetical protein [Olleya sp. YS]|uniref:hypothetical protein n=1 Tax=Olleya sp. YS TaxID=3028318 RepID=UPI002434492D|nr:hypothetical protein [Olleya sp. YS]WGD34389.1 hypothetical protein Ollyesu_11440 [Olleya sp. YS]